MKYFLNWWIVFCLVIAGSVASWYLKIFHMTNAADVTKISFIIYALFLIFTVRTGMLTYKHSKCKNFSQEDLDKFSGGHEISWFASDVFLTLGMLGTILGYIYMIQVGFAKMDPGNISSMHGALKSMALGWGTALYTTATGLICSLFLKLQLFNTVRQLEQMERECGFSNCPEVKRPTDVLPLQGLGV
jgi:hypothetical protein